MNLPSPNFGEKKPEKSSSSSDFISFSTPSTPYGISHTSPNFEKNFSQNVQQKYKQNSFQNHRNNYRGNNYKQNWNNRQGGNNRFQNNRQRHNSGNSSNQSPNTSGEVSWSVDAKGIDKRRSGGRNNPGNDNRSGRKGYFHPSMLENPWQRLEDRMDRSKWRTEDPDDEEADE